MFPMRHLFHKGVFVRNEERQKLPIEATKMTVLSTDDGHQDLYKEQPVDLSKEEADFVVLEMDSSRAPTKKSVFDGFDSFEDSFDSLIASKK